MCPKNSIQKNPNVYKIHPKSFNLTNHKNIDTLGENKFQIISILVYCVNQSLGFWWEIVWSYNCKETPYLLDILVFMYFYIYLTFDASLLTFCELQQMNCITISLPQILEI